MNESDQCEPIEQKKYFLKFCGVDTNCLNPQEIDSKIEVAYSSLGYREREIIKLRYGLRDGYTYTLEEVGRIFKITRERVRQLESTATRKSRKSLEGKI